MYVFSLFTRFYGLQNLVLLVFNLCVLAANVHISYIIGLCNVISMCMYDTVILASIIQGENDK